MGRKLKWVAGNLFACATVTLVASSWVAAECHYLDQAGIFRTAKTIDDVPAELRDKGRCDDAPKSEDGNSQGADAKHHSASQSKSSVAHASPAAGMTVHDIAPVLKAMGGDANSPTEAGIEGSARHDSIPTPIGRVEVRWARAVEELFDKNPRRAIQDAWSGAARALAQNPFPAKLRAPTYDWKLIVVLHPQANIDIDGGSGQCHPGWMQPPADIYVVAEKVVTGCSGKAMGKGEATQLLGTILVHELGHAVEFVLLDRAFTLRERWLSEGFATWFETLAAPYVPGKKDLATRAKMRARARAAWTRSWTPDQFRGSAEDYARSYALVAAIAERRGIERLAAVYQMMSDQQLRAPAAVTKVLGWTPDKWAAEVEQLLR